ncbi:hypothetical protein PoB_001492300 [Plakobranchus ocellatus]|uniref:Uncharacterized protein n=1 Tax=Plakobranchus ocellatus TaxID=259542 RepID=A0AAV3Z1N5_9GAST|nr:hypothetical protein PoB_001492300 [Plakobranchus ocellatus]
MNPLPTPLHPMNFLFTSLCHPIKPLLTPPRLFSPLCTPYSCHHIEFHISSPDAVSALLNPPHQILPLPTHHTPPYLILLHPSRPTSSNITPPQPKPKPSNFTPPHTTPSSLTLSDPIPSNYTPL